MPGELVMPNNQWKFTMLLADHAQALQGKLYIMGGGWTITGPAPCPSAIAIKIEVPWNEGNRQHSLKLTLIDGRGQPFPVQTPVGSAAIELTANFVCGRPAEIPPGTPLDVTLAFNFGPIPLPPGSRFAWRMKINDDDTKVSEVWFSTRQGPAVPPSPQ